jgi:hypothetical protein
MPGGHDTHGAMNIDARVIAAAQHGFADVDADSMATTIRACSSDRTALRKLAARLDAAVAYRGAPPGYH